MRRDGVFAAFIVRQPQSSRGRRPLSSVGACLTAGVIMLLGTSGCGQSAQQGNRTEALPGEVMTNWSNPIGGVAEASMRSAQRKVMFRLRPIPMLSDPFRILLTPDRPRAQRVVVLQYRTSAGLVDEYEEAPELSLPEFHTMIKHWVGLNGKPGTEGTSTAVRLASGYPALITTSPGGGTSDIRWIEGGVEYKVRGPSLTKKECIRLANLLVPVAR